MTDYRIPDLSTFAWQPPVASQRNSPPDIPGEGGRYLIGPSPTGAWIGHASEIAEWSGAAWDYTPPAAGMVVWNLDQETLLQYGVSWEIAITDGAPGADGATWYTGASAPGAGLGVDGDLYLNTSTSDVYRKSAGSWGII